MENIDYSNYIKVIIKQLQDEDCIKYDIKINNNIGELIIEFYEPDWYKSLNENTKTDVFNSVKYYYENYFKTTNNLAIEKINYNLELSKLYDNMSIDDNTYEKYDYCPLCSKQTLD